MKNLDLSITLSEAWSESEVLNPPASNDTRLQIIRFLLIESTHKTYKYILVNGLLGACAGNNPLVLQAQSKLPNAWDARSTCHKILVPFERSSMHSKLGGSNEPFLNKPARFPELSLSNAVRGGNDKQALSELIQLFSDRSIYDNAYSFLVYALSLIRAVQLISVVPRSDVVSGVELPLEAILEKSCDGESMLFVVGLVLQSLNTHAKVVCHKSNQSGASSKEVGDIDILLDSQIVSAIEVKDKPFAWHDYGHALEKSRVSGVRIFLFVSRESYISRAFRDLEKPCAVVSVESLIQIASALNFNVPRFSISEYCDHFISQANPKSETITHIKSILS